MANRFLLYLCLRVCLAAPCEVGSEGDLDQGCCMLHASGGGMPYWIFALLVVAFLLIAVICCLCAWRVLRKSRQTDMGGQRGETQELRESFDTDHSGMDGSTRIEMTHRL